MAESKRPFRLDLDKFREVVNHNNWFNLQHEFKTKGVSLSQSLLIWEEDPKTWLLADFDNKKAYDIEELEMDPVEVAFKNRRVEVSERSSEAEQPVTLTDNHAILSRLQSNPQGTNQGLIDFLKRINLEEIDLEGLKRSDLSGAGFSFEFTYPDLSIVYSMLREILTPSGKWALNFQRGVAQDVVSHLQQFYEKVQQIEDFEISGENPRETHDNLLQEISNFCDSVKASLIPIVAYLSSAKVGQLATEVDDMVAKLKSETNRAEENNNEAEQKQAERAQEFDRLKLELQNQLAEKPISQYKAIFADQAKEHHKGARNWLWIAIGATAAFFGVFWWLSTSLESGGAQLTGVLQNLFTKGFLLSPIYLWLNRSIKNYAAQKHLEVINTHRQNALETFGSFVDAAGENRETRDAVLLSATDAIFDANQTGYLSAKGSSADSKSPVQQVIREIIPDKSSPKS